MTDFLETAAMCRQRVTFDGGQQLPVRQRRLVRPGNKIRERHRAFATRGHKLNDGVVRDQAGCHIGGGRCIHDIAADGRLRADLIIGEPDSAKRHGRQGAAKCGLVEKALNRRCSTKSHPLFPDGNLTEFWNLCNVDQNGNMHVPGPAFARPGQRVRRASDDAIAAAIDLHRGKCVGQRGRT